eukprot:c4333_g1_i2 orf=289-534(+)
MGGARGGTGWWLLPAGAGAAAAAAAAPTSLSNSERNNHPCASNEELYPQFPKKIVYTPASKEGLIPYLSKKDINGVVRLKV